MARHGDMIIEFLYITVTQQKWHIKEKFFATACKHCGTKLKKQQQLNNFLSCKLNWKLGSESILTLILMISQRI